LDSEGRVTRGDIGYLLGFLGMLALTGVFISSGRWWGALIPGVIVLLSVGHMALNLSSPLDSEEVMSLLRAGGDYSSFEAFCDTPIINDRQLNRI
jgi:hypothetical protein